ncbi:hypothetical protein CFOL_v3_34245 [Cephalotus follicularis]|uniref:Uncharacterized protein n=1 Tax=Cephalotus follicularis TaxID=3775 RepID=A0A1Q3DEV9_CEPFO|nr:hypothetical protein CFOL_v3_34245 [Cephalotus follicularis]
MKKKGKVYPSQSSPSSSTPSSPHSVLNLLPLTVLDLALSLPLHDQEVLAYMMTRSILVTTTNTTNPSNPFFSHENKCKKTPPTTITNSVPRNPLFECSCFYCYTSFWYRWDSSPNQQLIHQVIDAFEDHLLLKESPRKQNNRGKKREKAMGRFESDMAEKDARKPEIPVVESEVMADVEYQEEEVMEINVRECEEEDEKEGVGDVPVVTVRGPWSSNHHKGLARKVLPDVIGLLNSRLWSLWRPGTY